MQLTQPPVVFIVCCFFPRPLLRSRVLKQLVFESNTSDAITLHQYNDIVEAGLTKEAGCAGITSAASRPAYSTVMQAVLAGLVLLWLL